MDDPTEGFHLAASQCGALIKQWAKSLKVTHTETRNKKYRYLSCLDNLVPLIVREFVSATARPNTADIVEVHSVGSANRSSWSRLPIRCYLMYIPCTSQTSTTTKHVPKDAILMYGRNFFVRVFILPGLSNEQKDIEDELNHRCRSAHEAVAGYFECKTASMYISSAVHVVHSPADGSPATFEGLDRKSESSAIHGNTGILGTWFHNQFNTEYGPCSPVVFQNKNTDKIELDSSGGLVRSNYAIVRSITRKFDGPNNGYKYIGVVTYVVYLPTFTKEQLESHILESVASGTAADPNENRHWQATIHASALDQYNSGIQIMNDIISDLSDLGNDSKPDVRARLKARWACILTGEKCPTETAVIKGEKSSKSLLALPDRNAYRGVHQYGTIIHAQDERLSAALTSTMQGSKTSVFSSIKRDSENRMELINDNEKLFAFVDTQMLEFGVLNALSSFLGQFDGETQKQVNKAGTDAASRMDNDVPYTEATKLDWQAKKTEAIRVAEENVSESRAKQREEAVKKLANDKGIADPDRIKTLVARASGGDERKRRDHDTEDIENVLKDAKNHGALLARPRPGMKVPQSLAVILPQQQSVVVSPVPTTVNGPPTTTVNATTVNGSPATPPPVPSTQNTPTPQQPKSILKKTVTISPTVK